jgi:hypothetical protein
MNLKDKIEGIVMEIIERSSKGAMDWDDSEEYTKKILDAVLEMVEYELKR